MAVYIGITTSLEENEQRLQHAYVQAVERAGGIPVIVPMLETEAALRAFVGLLDGLVITGGPAITQGLIGTLPKDLSQTAPLRVQSDQRLLRAFLDAQKPMLGICYGMQLLNAEAGGTIYADLEAQLDGAAAHSPKRGATPHPMYLAPGSHLHRVLQAETVEVNTRHIQAVAQVGAGFRVVGRAPDGVIEAIENETGTILGVQFHPEGLGEPMLPLFKYLVTCALAHKNTVDLLTA